MAEPTYLNLDDRRFLRAVLAGRVQLLADGRVMERQNHRNGRREASLQRAVEAGWVDECPNPTTGAYRLTGQGERDLAAREQPVAVTRG